VKIKDLLYAGLLAVTSAGCVKKNIVAEVPVHSFLINDYIVNVGSEIGNFNKLKFGDNEYCYFSKRLGNGDSMIIKDNNCDTFGERVTISGRNGSWFSTDFENLEEVTQEQLNLMIKITLEKKGVNYISPAVNFLD
jgi:hypothetical protein